MECLQMLLYVLLQTFLTELLSLCCYNKMNQHILTFCIRIKQSLSVRYNNLHYLQHCVHSVQYKCVINIHSQKVLTWAVTDNTKGVKQQQRFLIDHVLSSFSYNLLLFFSPQGQWGVCVSNFNPVHDFQPTYYCNFFCRNKVPHTYIELAGRTHNTVFFLPVFIQRITVYWTHPEQMLITYTMKKPRELFLNGYF